MGTISWIAYGYYFMYSLWIPYHGLPMGNVSLDFIWQLEKFPRCINIYFTVSEKVFVIQVTP